MISINDLTYYIGGKAIYEKAALHIKEKDKIGLIGPNGSGKTTLLKIILGENQIEGGQVSKHRDCTIGMLGQEISIIDESTSILSVAMQAFETLLRKKDQIDKLIKEIENDHDPAKISMLAGLQEEFEMKGGYSLQSKAEEILEGIGFMTNELSRPMREFSGGWKMRVILAKLLLERPSVLMLDEPTNHLDLPSIKWFENYIKSYEGAVIIVSHDKRFLDNTVSKILEIEDAKLIQYAGNYSDFVREKTMRRQIQENAHINQQKKVKEAEKFINRFRAKATKARQVQSKIKLMNKIDLIDNVKGETKGITFKFRFSQVSGKHVLDIRNVSKSYDNKHIFTKTNASLIRDDKVALIGANGLGKSTLLKIITNSIDYEGTCIQGHNVLLSYYAQHQIDTLTYENNILEELVRLESDYTELELRSILGSFLFSGDEVFKKIGHLSGGEKARVALAKVLISKANFLVMDEPTNHLDISSVDILTTALQQYQGSLIMVSHDRQFIESIANKIWFIEEKKIREYPGRYSEYEIWTGKMKQQDRIYPAKNGPKTTKNNKSSSFEYQKKYKNKLNALKGKLEKLEEYISGLEEKKTSIEMKMHSPEIYSNYEKLTRLTQELDSIKDQLKKEHGEWEDLFVQIEKFEKFTF